MTSSRARCLLLLLAVLAGSLLGSVYSAKQGCPGDNILLFQNIPVDQDLTVFKLFVNGIYYTEIGVWTIQKCVRNTTFVNGYEDRISLDQYGNIWIRNLQDKDEGNYSIEIITRKLKYDVELNVFGREHIKLEWTLEIKYVNCIRRRNGVANNKGSTIKLIPGQDVGTVYACINSPALRCLNNSKLFGYCTASKGRIQNKVTDVSTVTTTTLVLIILVIIVGIPTALYIQYRCLKDMLKKNATSPNNEDAQSLLDVHPTDPGGDESNESGVGSGTNRTS